MRMRKCHTYEIVRNGNKVNVSNNCKTLKKSPFVYIINMVIGILFKKEI